MLVFVFIAMYFCPDESLSLHISNCVVICFQKSVFLWLWVLSGPVVGCWWMVVGGWWAEVKRLLQKQLNTTNRGLVVLVLVLVALVIVVLVLVLVVLVVLVLNRGPPLTLRYTTTTKTTTVPHTSTQNNQATDRLSILHNTTQHTLMSVCTAKTRDNTTQLNTNTRECSTCLHISAEHMAVFNTTEVNPKWASILALSW